MQVSPREAAGPGARGSGAHNAGGALGVNLSSSRRGSVSSSRRRRSGRGPAGCSRTAAALGPPPHDRAAASGSRAPLMPCRGQLASGRARVEQRARGPRLRCRSELAPKVGSVPRSSTALVSLPLDLVAPAFPKGLGVAGTLCERGLLYCPSPASRRLPLALLPSARPALPSPRAEPSVQAFALIHFANFQCHLSPSAPGNRLSRFSLGD